RPARGTWRERGVSFRSHTENGWGEQEKTTPSFPSGFRAVGRKAEPPTAQPVATPRTGGIQLPLSRGKAPIRHVHTVLAELISQTFGQKTGHTLCWLHTWSPGASRCNRSLRKRI